jgi:tRNA (cytidine/uridine-2'-O-)-methyltransferase
MLHIGLYEPEIPPNTGNIMRLCAEHRLRTAPRETLGFSLDDRQLRRAGLDYRDHAEVAVHDSMEALLEAVAPGRCWALSTRGYRSYTDAAYRDGDLLLFGPETRGLPQELLDDLGGRRCLRIPCYRTAAAST